jgi:hypothetical protein
MPRHLGKVALALAAAVAIFAPARAQASDDALAVLGIDAIEVGDAMGTQLTDALRRKAAETAGVHLVTGKDLVELKMVFNCDGEAPACLAQAGRSLGADKLIYGTMKKAEQGRAVLITLKLLDVRDLVIQKQITETIQKRLLGPPQIVANANRWFGQLVVPAQVGSIQVQSQPADATVLIDGQPVGRTPFKSKDLRPRTYSVVVQLDGYIQQTRTIDVHAGSTETVMLKLEREQRVVEAPPKPPSTGHVELVPSQPEQPAQRPRHPGRPAKYAAIGLVAGAVVAGAVAIYTWRSYVRLEDSATASLRSLAPPTGTHEQQIFYGKPECRTPPGATDQAAAGYVSDCDSGNKYAGATTGLWVTAGVLAAAGVVTFIVGERMDAKAEKADKADRERRGQTMNQTIRESLRLVPALSTKGGGLSASFEF